jgi:CheY-like chemotaxis protein
MKSTTILVVEDDSVNQFIMKKLLEKEYSCSYAVNDKEVFQATEHTVFDVILMDINLGNGSLDGEQIMKQLRTDSRFKDTQIFSVTSYALDSDREHFLAAGFDRYFMKPINKQAILSAIGEVETSLQSVRTQQ